MHCILYNTDRHINLMMLITCLNFKEAGLAQKVHLISMSLQRHNWYESANHTVFRPVKGQFLCESIHSPVFLGHQVLSVGNRTRKFHTD